MKALILAAGYAVRLGELTRNTPKSLLPVGGKTIMDRIVEKVMAAGPVDSLLVVTNGKFFGEFEKWASGSAYKEKIILVNDNTMTNETRLGAIKDMEFAISRKAVDDDLLVVAGDNLFEFDLGSFIKFAQSKGDAVSIAIHDIKDVSLAVKFGVLSLGEGGRVIDFEEKPAKPKSSLISTGIYYFPKNKLSLIKKYVTIQDEKLDAPGNYIGWAAKNDKVYGFAFSEDWYDIGSVESYRQADSDYEKRKGKGNGEE